MDCAYKNDGGANANVVDKILDSNNFLLEKTSADISTNSSMLSSGVLKAVVTNGGSDHFFQIKCNGNKSISSGFSLDNQMVLSNNNIINETNKLETDLDQKATLDRLLLSESGERTAKRKCFDVEVKQLNLVPSSNGVKDFSFDEESSSLKNAEKGVINDELSKQKLDGIPQDIENPSNVNHEEIDPLANPVCTNLKEANTDKECLNTESEHSFVSEIGRNVIEENQTSSDSGVNCQSVDTPFSSSENIDECVSEEEVYLEVDEICGSDVSDVASEGEDRDDTEERDLQIDGDCRKTVNTLIKNIEDAKTECELPVEDADPTTLPLNTFQCLDSQDEPMSEEEVYEEIEEDIDEDSILEIQDEVSDSKAIVGANKLPASIDNRKLENDSVIKDRNSDNDSVIKDHNLDNDLVISKLDDHKLPEDPKNQSNIEFKEVVSEEKNSRGEDMENAVGTSIKRELVINDKSECNDRQMNVSNECDKSIIVSEKEDVLLCSSSNREKKLYDIKEITTFSETASVTEEVKEVLRVKTAEVLSEKVKDILPEKMEGILPEKLEENLPEKEENLPEKEEILPEKMEEILPEKVKEILPEKMEEVLSENKQGVNVPSVNVEVNAQEKNQQMNVIECPKKSLRGDDSDDEFDSLIEQFVVTQCSNEDTKIESLKSEILMVESEDEPEVIMEACKEVNSDDDCLIVEDTSKEIVINIESESSKRNNVQSNLLIIDADDSSNIPLGKGLETEEMRLNSSNIGTKVKLKDSIDKTVNNVLTPSISEQISNVDSIILDEAKPQENVKSTIDEPSFSKLGGKSDALQVGASDCESSIVEGISDKTINLPSKNLNESQSNIVTEDRHLCASSGVEGDSVLNKKALTWTGNKLSLNCGLFAKVDYEKSLIENRVNTEESTQASTKGVLSDLLTEVSTPISVFKDCNAKLSSCDARLQQNSDSSSNIHQEVSFEADNKFNSLSTSDENSEKESCQKSEMDEIIIDCFDPSERASKLNSGVTDTSEKYLIKEDSKKRMFEEVESINSAEINKKLKPDEISIEIPLDCNLEVQKKIQEKALELIPQENSFKFITSKKVLDKIVKHIVAKNLEDVEPINHIQARKNVDEAEDIFQVLDEDFQLFNVQVTDFVAAQEEKFQQKNFNPQVQTRTVGVNVKIFRECDLQNLSPAPALSQNSSQIPSTMGSHVTNKPVLPAPANKSPIVTSMPQRPNNPMSSVVSRPMAQTQQIPVIRRTLAPAIVTNASRPRQIIPGQRFTTVSPNVTIAGNPLASLLTTTVANRPLLSQPSVTAARVAAPNANHLIDLTKDAAINRQRLSTIASSVPNANIPRLGNNQNVLVPLSNFFQMLPSQQNNPQLASGNQMQITHQPVFQPALRPALGPRTVAYLMPSGNSAQITTLGGRGSLPVSSFLSTAPNQRVQTFVVRVTNPGQAPPLSSLVSSTPRMQTPPNVVNTNIGTIPTTRGLVLFPRAANKHPAPFPQTPIYPMNTKLRLMPPQPSLKGSRAPQQGIILSWNMNLHSSHAEISNYQLFAYQETNAPATSSLWKKVGDIKALPLPMACTLTQFVEGHQYFFTVRAVDVHNRIGPFSDSVTIMYSKQDNSQAPNK